MRTVSSILRVLVYRGRSGSYIRTRTRKREETHRSAGACVESLA
jgi:hypothetical protein